MEEVVYAGIDDYVEECRRNQPIIMDDLRRLFEAYILFPPHDETLLQSYVFHHIEELFPSCTDLVLYEHALRADRSDLGEVDFLYRNRDGGLTVIETKYIDLEGTGRTLRTKRNRDRTFVLKQALRFKGILDEMIVDNGAISSGVVTTDDKVESIPMHKKEFSGPEIRTVPILDLKAWRSRMYPELTGRELLVDAPADPLDKDL